MSSLLPAVPLLKASPLVDTKRKYSVFSCIIIRTKYWSSHTHVDECAVRWAFGWTVTHDIPDDCPLPPGMGSSYVDVGLKVVVQSAAGTLSAFQPNHLHGTTFTGGIVNYGLSMTSTRRVNDAIWEIEQIGTHVRYCLDTDKHEDGHDPEAD